MTRDGVIRLAREAGLCDEEGRDDDSIIIVSHLERFAALVAAHEREECAKVCELESESKTYHTGDLQEACDICAAAIRARGNV